MSKENTANLEEAVCETNKTDDTANLEEATNISTDIPDTIKGIVVDCLTLAVRHLPSAKSSMLFTLNELSEVEITLSESTDDFYKVKTSEGVEGYCMKMFIATK